MSWPAAPDPRGHHLPSPPHIRVGEVTAVGGRPPAPPTTRPVIQPELNIGLT